MNWNDYITNAKQHAHRAVPGKISASCLPRLLECPGSLNIYGESEGGEAAWLGTACHEILANDAEIPDDAPEAAREQIEFCRQQVDRLKGEGWQIMGREAWLESDRICGTCDLIMKKDGATLVIDYKTGRGAVPLKDNAQLAGYASIIDEQYGDPWRSYFGLILQLHAGSGADNLYQMVETSSMVNRVLAGVMDGRRIPCKHCQYCQACGTSECAESGGAITAPISAEIDTPERIAAILDAAPHIEAIIEAARKKARQIIEAGGTVGNWYIGKGTSVREIADAEKAFQRFHDIIDAPTFLKAVSVSISGIEKAVADAKGMKKKDAAALVAERLDDIITKTTRKGPLKNRGDK